MDQRRLGQMEQAFTLTDEAFGLAVVGVLRLRNGPKPAHLVQALQHVQARHPLLSVAIVRQGRRIVFEPVSPEAIIPLDVVTRESDEHWKTVVEQHLNRQFGLGRGPLLRCTYLTTGETGGPSELICVFHHAIMDATSNTQLYHELLTECLVLQGNEPIEREPAVSQAMPLPIEALLPPGYRGWQLVRRIVPFVVRQIREDRTYRKQVSGHREEPVLPQSVCRIHTSSLSASDTLKLIKKSRRENVTVNSALSAAMLLAVGRCHYQQKPGLWRALVFSDLRPYLKPPPPPEQLGCYISMQRVGVSISFRDTLWDVSHRIADKIYAANSRGEKFLSALVSKILMQNMLRKQSERMATTALSYSGPLKLLNSYGAIRVADVHGFITTNCLSPILSGSGRLFQGRLRLDFMYMDADMNPETAEDIISEIKQLLLA